jgi:flagellar biosynthetic protein FlhB
MSEVLRAPRDALSVDGQPLSEELFTAELAAMDLQWFAAEDEGRTEDPTEHKIRKAREEGKVAKSQDLSGAIVLLFSIVTIALIAPYLLRTMEEMVSFYLVNSTEIDVRSDGTAARAFYDYFVRLVVPVGAVAFVAAVLGNVIQVGFLFSTKTITPDFSKVAPKFGKYIQRSFFSAEAGFNLAKATGKVLIIGSIAFLNVQSRLGRIMNLVNVPFQQGFRLVATLAFNVLFQVALVLVFLAIFDYMFQRYQHRESLKMTRQEIKEERKTYEGDPLVKNRLRQRMQEILGRNMIRKVPEADVVVTNPTHFSVALEYKREQMEAPTVTAKGEDNMALRIRELARESGVPLVENRPLARALYAEVELGDTIPEKYYEAVVAVLKQVYSMDEQRRRAAMGSA